jgi:hypothetical protein
MLDVSQIAKKCPTPGNHPYCSDPQRAMEGVREHYSTARMASRALEVYKMIAAQQTLKSARTEVRRHTV